MVVFLDRQLSGFYGRGQRWYMRGPFPEPLETQGYQSEHAPAGLWRHGLAALDAHCRQTHDGRDFADLTEEEQDMVLTAIDDEEVEFESISAKQFFDFAKEMTIEGFFAIQPMAATATWPDGAMSAFRAPATTIAIICTTMARGSTCRPSG